VRAGPGRPTLFLNIGLERRPTIQASRPTGGSAADQGVRRTFGHLANGHTSAQAGFPFDNLRAGFRFAGFFRAGWLRPAF
jgi:hypothetical protein